MYLNSPSTRPPSLQYRPVEVAAERPLTILDLWSILRRRKAMIAATLAFAMLATGVYCALSTRLYQAKARVEVQKESADALGLESIISSPEPGTDALEASITLQTQAELLQSDSLALQVIQELHLEQTKDYRPRFSLIGWILGPFSPRGIPDRANVPLEDAPGRRTRVVKTFESKLKVKPIAGTRLIEITYLSSDPVIAAAIINHLVQDLIADNFQTRHTATQEATAWLGTQLQDLRKQSQDLQARVVSLQRDSGVFTLGQTDTKGREQVYTPALDRLQLATTQLSEAQSARILKGALYEVVKDGDPELISGLAGSGVLSSATAGVSGSLTFIQSLRAQEAAAQGQFNQLSEKFGPDYPKVAEARANLESIQKAILAESARLAGRVKNDYKVAQQVEDSARAVFLVEKNKANALNDKAIEYEIVQQEALQSRNLYESLLKRLKEADLVAGLRTSNISLVDLARVPARPAKPNVPIYMAGSVCGGLFLGICAALFREATDNTIQDPAKLEACLAGPALRMLPYHRLAKTGGSDWRLSPSSALPAMLGGGLFAAGPRGAILESRNSFVAVDDPRAAYTEAVRSLRTAVLQGNGNARTPQLILVTSSVPGEGKSMLSANLAVLLAQQDKRVLLVDGDLRTPVLHHRFNLQAPAGLATLLAEHAPLEDAASAIVPLARVPKLDLLPAGPIPINPAELLSSNRMTELLDAWRQRYDFIVLDAAPTLPVTDSAILTRHADLTLLVARYDLTDVRALERSVSLLKDGGAGRMEVVLNGVRASAANYYGYNSATYYGREHRAHA
jgi:polysaccharide biosynthesis transport protein